jgi:hypothetical protein
MTTTPATAISNNRTRSSLSHSATLTTVGASPYLSLNGNASLPGS